MRRAGIGRLHKAISCGDLPGVEALVTAGASLDKYHATAAPLRSAIPWHQQMVWATAFSPDGRIALSAGKDGAVKLWDGRTGDPLGALLGHAGEVRSAAFFPDGARAISAGGDGALRIWDLTTRRQLHAFTPPASTSLRMALAPDGRFAVVAQIGPATYPFELYDFALAERYRAFEPRLAVARDALARDPGDASALAVLGEWYAFRGASDWAARFMTKARKAGAKVSSLELGRSHWRRGDLAAAASEIEAALSAGEAPAPYLKLCLKAIESERRPVAPHVSVVPPGTKIVRLEVMDSRADAPWSVERNLQAGDKGISGSDFPLTSVSAELRGLDWIRPANNSRTYRGWPLVELTLGEGATVYVAVDSVHVPSWLSPPWTETDASLSIRDANGTYTHRVFKRVVGAGPIALGPYDYNYANMYIVAIK